MAAFPFFWVVVLDKQHPTKRGNATLLSSPVRIREKTPMPEARPPARTFSDLVVWQQAHAFVLAVYKFTASLPKQETYGLTAQMRRAAVSIPANIAEGFGKRSRADKARHFNIAEASVEESRYYLILARDLGYRQPDDLHHLLDQVSRLLNSYARSLLAPGS